MRFKVKRCLSISNILRGFSFLPGNEAPMSRHAGLLYIVGRLLRLYADERPITRPKALGVKLEFNKVLSYASLRKKYLFFVRLSCEFASNLPI